MKLKLFILVLGLSLTSIAIAQNPPVCLRICPPDAGPDDEITVTAYDEFDAKVDLSEWTGGVEMNFAGSGEDGFMIYPGDPEMVDGSVVIVLGEARFNHNQWDFFTWIPDGPDSWLPVAMPDFAEGAIFDWVPDAIDAGGTCPSVICDIPNPIIIDPNVMTVYEEGETEGDFGVSLRNEPPSGHTITVTVDPNNGNPSDDIMLIGGSGPIGSIDRTHWQYRFDFQFEQLGHSANGCL
jgi:hypothetical protein